MFRRKWIVAIAIVTVVVALAVPVAVMALPVSQTAPSVAVDLTATPLENGMATFEIFVTNNSAEAIDGVTINVPLPAGTAMQSSFAGTPGTLPATMTATGLQWMHGTLAAGEKTGPYSFTVSTTADSVPAVSAIASWTGPVAGSVASDAVAAEPPAAAAQAPRRGCFSCHAPGQTHNLVDEANSGAKIMGVTHPALAEDVTVRDCLGCHGAGTGSRAGLGTVANLSLRDIVHPAHMFSSIFPTELGGTCFSCHNVDGSGDFVLLNEPLETNVKGVPLHPPVMGIPPSEDMATAGQTTTGRGGSQ